MNKKSFQNAILAAGYISLVGTFMNWTNHMPHPPSDNIFMPMAVLALLVLSVALMGMLFFYEPVLLLLAGKRAEAVKLFFGTLSIFAGLTIIYIVLAIFIIPWL